MKPFIAEIKHYNVSYYLLISTEQEAYKYSCLAKRIENSANIKMKDLHQWCNAQQITYKTKFRYRRDYPFTKLSEKAHCVSCGMNRSF